MELGFTRTLGFPRSCSGVSCRTVPFSSFVRRPLVVSKSSDSISAPQAASLRAVGTCTVLLFAGEQRSVKATWVLQAASGQGMASS